MTVRHKFGGGITDWTYSYTGDDLVQRLSGATVTFWDSLTGGTQYVDLTDTAGSAISSVTSDSNGYIPEFYGPPVWSLWRIAADAAGGAGPRRWIYAADIGPSIQTHQQMVYARGGPLQPWTAGLANRHSARCSIACIGNSITDGQGATDVDRRYLARLRDMLRARYPTRGNPTGGRGFLGAAACSGLSSFTWPSTLTGGPTVVSGDLAYGPKINHVQLASTGQQVAWSLTGDSADIYWTRVPSGGTFSWKVDAGGTTNVSTSGTLLDGQVTHVSLGSAGAHTLTLAWVSGTSNISGVVEYNGDYASGIQVHDCGHFGYAATDYTNSWSTYTKDTTAGPAGAVAALAAQLWVIELGYNDLAIGFSPSNFYDGVRLIISNIRACLTSPFPAVVLAMLPPKNGTNNGTTGAYPWWQYIDAAHNVAAADTGGVDGGSIVSVMDFTIGPRMMSSDTDASNLHGLWHVGDLTHPSDKGHALIADALCSFLSV